MSEGRQCVGGSPAPASDLLIIKKSAMGRAGRPPPTNAGAFPATGHDPVPFMTILVFNVGSSSVKFSLFQGNELEPVLSHSHSLKEATGGREEIFSEISAQMDTFRIDAIGHRFVHGGSEFHGPTLISPSVRIKLEQLSQLAPLHQPPALQILDLAFERFPGIPQYAAFDTGFFFDLPLESQIYPVPFEWYEIHHIRRFGFHGLSHKASWSRLAELAGEEASRSKIVIAHLGSGCSLCAIQNGKPVETTMGFTPLDGVMMGTRPGSLDPGILLHLLRNGIKTLSELEEELQSRSGLLGVSGVSSDIRNILSEADAGNPRASIARDQFCQSIRGEIASLTVRMGGLDHLIFTGGIGTNSVEIRERILGNLSPLGCDFDATENATAVPDCKISTPHSKVQIHVFESREEVEIARSIVQLPPN